MVKRGLFVSRPQNRAPRRLSASVAVLAAVVGGLVAGGVLTDAQGSSAVYAASINDVATPGTSTPTPVATPLTTSPPSFTTPPATTPPATGTPASAPTITAPGAGTFIGRSSTTVSGTRDAGQEVQVFVANGAEPSCIVAANGTGSWSCDAVRLPSGSAVPIRVVVSGDASLSATISVAVLGAPVVTGGPTGQSSSNGTVRGTGYPGATVSASLPSGAQCYAVVDGGGTWSCALTGSVPSGNHAVSASQMSDFSSPSSSNTSAATTVLFDLDRPAVPVILSPVTGTIVSLAGSSYSGTGEDGATVSVYAGPSPACTTTVSAGSWACSTTSVAAGAYRVIAVQQDAAGNLSGGSDAVTLTFANTTLHSASATPSPSPSEVAPDAAVPLVPVPAPAESNTPGTQSPSATPSPQEDADAQAGAAGPVYRPPGSWNDPTRFATAIPFGFAQGVPWLQAIALSFGVLLLIVLPALMLSGTISRARGGRPLWKPARIAGRNRAAVEFETAPTWRVNRWFVEASAVLAAAALVVLSGPVADQPAYLRLLIASVVSVAVVNVVAVAVPLWWSTRVLNTPASYRFVPASLVVVAVAALASRFLDLNPAILFGLLTAITVGAASTDAGALPTPAAQAREVVARGRIGAVRAISMILLGAVAWLTLVILPPATGLASTFAAEFMNIVALSSIGSAVVMLTPLARTSGRAVLHWSPAVWAGLFALALTGLFLAMLPAITVANTNGTAAIVWIAAIGFAAISVCVWAWHKYIAPIIR